MEIWKNIKGYEDRYQVSNEGRIKSLIGKEKILKGGIDVNGYRIVCLYKNNVKKNYLIHRLVAEAFLPNPENLPTVDHVNRIKSDNNVENLRWANERLQQKNKNTSKSADCYRKVRGTSIVDESVIEFNRSIFAEHWLRENNLCESARSGKPAQQIRQCCNGYLQTYCGYHWEFI